MLFEDFISGVVSVTRFPQQCSCNIPFERTCMGHTGADLCQRPPRGINHSLRSFLAIKVSALEKNAKTAFKPGLIVSVQQWKNRSWKFTKSFWQKEHGDWDSDGGVAVHVHTSKMSLLWKPGHTWREINRFIGRVTILWGTALKSFHCLCEILTRSFRHGWLMCLFWILEKVLRARYTVLIQDWARF